MISGETYTELLASGRPDAGGARTDLRARPSVHAPTLAHPA
jgi:hypothetical protein